MNSEARSEVNSQVVVDWCVCCGCEVVAPQFVKSGIDSIKDLRDLEEDQFRKIVRSSWVEYDKLQDRTSTVEELSQEVSVSVFVNVTLCAHASFLEQVSWSS